MFDERFWRRPTTSAGHEVTSPRHERPRQRRLEKALVGVLLAAAASAGCYEFWYGLQHERQLARLVERQATEKEIVLQLGLGDPDFTMTGDDPVLTPDGMIAAWAISKKLAEEIRRKILAHPKTIVFARTMVDFIYLDESGRATTYIMFGN